MFTFTMSLSQKQLYKNSKNELYSRLRNVVMQKVCQLLKAFRRGENILIGGDPKNLDDRDEMIPFCQTDNDFLDICYKHFSIVFLYQFCHVLYTVVNYPKTWFTGSFLALSANKSNKFYNKIPSF